MVLDVVDGLDARASLAPDPRPPVYFSLLDRVAFVGTLRTAVVLGWIIAILGVLSWVATLAA